MIRLGIIGTNYGRTVQLPAFRADRRCQVLALAGRDAARTQKLAAEAGVAKGYADWRTLIADKDIDAVAIATLPALQAEIACAALAAGKPVFAEKPMASTLAAARTMLAAAQKTGRPTLVDFNFHQVMSWQRAKQMFEAGAIGTLRHVVVNWQIENYVDPAAHAQLEDAGRRRRRRARQFHFALLPLSRMVLRAGGTGFGAAVRTTRRR